MHLLLQRIFNTFPRIYYCSNFAYSQASQYISLSNFNRKYLSSIHFPYQWLPNLPSNYNSRKRVVALFDEISYKRYFCTSNYYYKFKERRTAFEIYEDSLQLDEVFEKKFLSQEEWSSIIEEAPSKLKFFSKDVFDTLIIQKCLNLNNIDLAISYFDCQSLKDINFSALSFYLLLLGRNINTVRSGLFYEVYEILKGHHPLPDNIIGNIVEALCLTNCELAIPHINYLENSKSSFQVKTNSYNYLAQALINNKSLEKGMNYLLLKKSTLKNETVETAFSVISRISNDDERKGQLMSLVKYLHDFEATLSLKNEELLSSVCENILSIDRLKISNGEQCHSCCGSLNLVPLDKEMVTALKNAFEKSAVRGPDIYQNTTPKEWSNFKNFLHSEGAFDVVVDGLNFLLGGEMRKTDRDIVKFFHFLSEHYGKILIVSRIHTKERFERLKYMSPKFEKIHLFYLDNQTKDDVYILYGALYSGMGCHLITRDFMRNYNFVMRKHSHLMKTFLYWQSLHQFIIPDGVKLYNFFQPYQYHRVPQYNDTTKSWHLPIDSGEEYDYFVPEDEWICLKDLKVDGSVVGRNADPWDKLLNNVAEKCAPKDKYYNFKKKPEVHFCDKNKEKNSMSVNKYRDDTFNQ